MIPFSFPIHILYYETSYIATEKSSPIPIFKRKRKEVGLVYINIYNNYIHTYTYTARLWGVILGQYRALILGQSVIIRLIQWLYGTLTLGLTLGLVARSRGRGVVSVCRSRIKVLLYETFTYGKKFSEMVTNFTILSFLYFYRFDFLYWFDVFILLMFYTITFYISILMFLYCLCVILLLIMMCIVIIVNVYTVLVPIAWVLLSLKNGVLGVILSI